MSKAKLKPCPFCGKAVVLTHGEINKMPKNRPAFARGDYSIEWSISCMNCGIAKIEKVGTYILDREGNLVTADKEDVKNSITDTWNRRVGSE